MREVTLRRIHTHTHASSVQCAVAFMRVLLFLIAGEVRASDRPDSTQQCSTRLQSGDGSGCLPCRVRTTQTVTTKPCYLCSAGTSRCIHGGMNNKLLEIETVTAVLLRVLVFWDVTQGRWF